jgi:hypothetical protein
MVQFFEFPALVAYKIVNVAACLYSVFSCIPYVTGIVIYARLTNTGKYSGGPDMGTTAMGHTN